MTNIKGQNLNQLFPKEKPQNNCFNCPNIYNNVVCIACNRKIIYQVEKEGEQNGR